MRQRIASLAVLAVLAYGCATTRPAPVATAESLHGVASWYGEEFAGRTTANGEIFDPLLLTAAHRTLPFGTVVDVVNPKTNQSVRVRVNDRGPYVGNRVIDLSYAAAQQIGLIEPGIGEVEIRIVQVGKGDREPPAPYSVTVAGNPKTAPQVSAGDPPKVDFPIPARAPSPPAPAPAAAEPDAVIDRVEVVEQHAGVITRRQVSPDGKTIETVPVVESTPAAPGAAGGTAPSPVPAPESPAASRRPRKASGFVVQVGAFSLEANAKLLQERLARIGQQAFVDAGELWRVRIGPFATRELAIKTRAALEVNGISAIIVAE